MKFFILVSLMFVVSCATNKARKNIATSKVIFNGGVYNNEQWNDKLVFKRTSWFHEASMDYDILFLTIDNSSKFANWMGKDKKLLSTCSKFYIAMIYADLNAPNGVSFITNQIDTLGVKEHLVPSFKGNLMAHDNFRDWRLSRHKVFGFCRPEDLKDDIEISVPGFKLVKL